MLALSQAGAQTNVDWKDNTTGSWFDPANWWNGYIPTSAYNAAIDNNGDASVPHNTGVPGSASTLNVGIDGKGTLRIVSAGGIVATIAYLGNNASGDGTLIVNGGESYLTLSSNISVGERGTALLDINAGGVVSNAYGKVGVFSGSRGKVSVAGETSAWNNSGDVLVGESGTGILNVSSAATVKSTQGFLGYNGTGDGTVSVDGIGSIWKLRSYLFVGYFGTARLDITAGGKVATDETSTSASSASVGHLGGSNGDVSVTGVGSTWAIKDDLSVGEQGTGTLTISNKGTVSNSYGTIGNYASGSGTVTINGVGSTWTNRNDLIVGKSGTGNLTVREGGTVKSSSGYVGYGATNTSAATINGTGSRWENTASLHVGYQGAGTLNIEAGGTVTSVDGSIGEDNGTMEGVVNISGVGSAWNASGDLSIGEAGKGILNIREGGAVDSSNASLGVLSAGNGEVNLSGADTLWTIRSSLYVGRSGLGKVNINTGATATAATATIGEQLSSFTSEVNVSGDGSLWEVSSSVIIGDAGMGKLNITSGGQSSAASAILGNAVGSSGELNINNIGSSWQVTGTLTIGNLGVGALGMQGGEVASGAAMLGAQAGSSGTANVSSGIWNTDSLIVGGAGSGTINLSGDGVVKIGATGNGTVTLAEAEGSVGTLVIGQGDTAGALQASSVTGGLGTASVNFNHSVTVNFAPTLAGNLSVTKSGTGRLVFDYENTYTGLTTVADGTLKVGNSSGSATGSGKVIVDRLGTLVGDGKVAGEVEISGTISPGDSSVATLSTGSQTWKNEGVYDWEIQSLNGPTGSTWDLLKIDGNLTIESTLENPFTIAISTLTLEGQAGLLQGFSDTQNYSWTILSVTGSIGPWSLGQIVLDVSGFANDHLSGTFSLIQDEKDLNLVYTVPEPSSWIMLLLGALGLALPLWRTRNQTAAGGSNKRLS
ncbi:PEP-CTERM protein-sorting domain-containing protein [Terrimicrobium sacchariphilum]|uniref:PEP-CTERM protein-sorting domain-containing protein n=1 Tax=Terrimicrobium sacchariphilum TaxID=690879 RepID=A0A146G951_TERSA|nr:autotransporter-associated beta strand repeat-containing protein [Terrimicrobium sacchariphilum]GAT33813.1 PEP-CTERM protein-sorting domain-containing protein [Terrimicrobium sacchariphilum]